MKEIFSQYCVSLMVVLLTSSFSVAEPVSIYYDNLKLNAEIKPTANKTQPFFLILHGTFAWHGMELPSTLQALLEEEGFGSLALTLSLGQSDRSGFFDCTQPIISRHGDAQKEIGYWVSFLRQQGYNNIVLVGHSRGGAQIAEYGFSNPEDIKQIFLIAPMVWKQSVVSARYQAKNSIELEKVLTKAKKGSKLLAGQNILYCNNANVSVEALVSYFSRLPEKNTPTILAKATIPTRLYLGTEDPLSFSLLKQQNVFSQNLNITQYSIDGADHFFRDLYADDLVADMLEALK